MDTLIKKFLLALSFTFKINIYTFKHFAINGNGKHTTVLVVAPPPPFSSTQVEDKQNNIINIPINTFFAKQDKMKLADILFNYA